MRVCAGRPGFHSRVLAALLLCLFSASHATKSASSFTPAQQFLHVGVTLTVHGTQLSTADVVMLELAGTGGPTCGNSTHPPHPAGGIEPRNFVEVSSDGMFAYLTMTPSTTVTNAVLCIKLFPSQSWSQIGTGTFSVHSPTITATTTSFGAAANAYDPFSFTITGNGLVCGILRLAFKASGLPCGGTSPTSDLTGGDAVGLNHANADGTTGSFGFTLHLSTSLTGTLRMCMSSNGGAYVDVPSLSGFTVLARTATAFTPDNIQMRPSSPYSFTVTGTNFAASGSSTLSIKAMGGPCSGSSASDLIGGDAIEATFVSSTSSTVTFKIGAIFESVSEISIFSAGKGYITGSIAAYGGGGNSFSGAFGVGVQGEIDVVYISQHGKEYASAPVLEAIHSGTVRCGGILSKTCNMTGSVTQIVQKGGKTRGCVVGALIIAHNDSGGFGFQAVVERVDDLVQEIQSIRITDYGVGYKGAPKLMFAFPGSCKCGTFIVDGSPTADSFVDVGVPGGLDACFVSVVALGGSFRVNGGWNLRKVKLCARFGAASMWSQISAATVNLLLPATSSFSPTNVASGQPFTLQIFGSGFELDGPVQLKIKIAHDCDSYQTSDKLGALPGGVGRACDSLSYSGETQTCHVQFKLVIPGTLIEAQICHRFGGGQYARVSSTSLSISGFQMLSISPTLAASNTPYIVTVSGINFDPSLTGVTDPTYTGVLLAKVCANFTCRGGFANANNGEPCAGTTDQRMCTADAYCEPEVVCKADMTGSEGAFPGSGTATVLRVQNCNTENWACTEAVFTWTLISMANVPGQIYWMYDFLQYAKFALLPGSRFLVEGSWLTDFSQRPASPIFSGSPLYLTISGKNLVNSGPGAIKFKWVNTTQCQGVLLFDTVRGPYSPGTDDDTWVFTGGNGRSLNTFIDNIFQAEGEVKFVLASPNRPEPTTARLCWRIGNYRWREVEVYRAASLNSGVLSVKGFGSPYYFGHTTLVTGTLVDYMSPTDFNWTTSTKIALGKQALPFFESGSTYQVTVFGSRFGDSAADSPLVLRPIPMPFALDDTAINCIKSETTDATRPKTCKEFRKNDDAYDGGASKFCSGGPDGSSILEDYYPARVVNYMETKSGGTTQMSYAVFSFSKVLFEFKSRFMVCWSMYAGGYYNFPWATIGHIDYRQVNLGTMGISSFDVWVTHTFAMNGAFIVSVVPEPEIVANRPFKLKMVGVGTGCDPIWFKVKLAIANGVQALVGGPIGGGCELGANSDSEGAVMGGDAVTPTCRKDLSSGRQSMVEMEFTVLVDGKTRLQLCWSSTSGKPVFKAAFYVGGVQFVEVEAKPWYIRQFLIDNVPIGNSPKLMAHKPFTLTILGEGLQKTGPTKLNISIAENCEDDTTVVPGGDWRTVDCIFGNRAATVEFVLFTQVKDAQICLFRASTSMTFGRYLARSPSRLYCDNEYCGAPSCQQGTTYLSDGFGCDEDCCREQCANDRFCNFWQRYEFPVQPDRIFRRCQTMAHCKDPQVLTAIDRSPIIWQKIQGMGKEVYAAATIPVVDNPVVLAVTPQVNPPLRARIPFVVNVQGVGFVMEHVQIHVKIANTEIGCNDKQAFNRSITMWNKRMAERNEVFAQLEFSKNFSYNGTCGGGNKNCEGGPAPPGSICLNDGDCLPAAGGKCISPNTGMSCLHDYQCTYQGICNGSLYNLSMTPPPEPPPMEVPFEELSDAGTLLGGTGKFLNVLNFSFGFVTFQINESADGVLCYNIRNKEQEERFIREAHGEKYITDLRLVNAMSTYISARTLTISMPEVRTVSPDHTFLFVDTLYIVGGVGLSTQDKMKIAHPSLGCSKEGLDPSEEDTYGSVKGGVGIQFEAMNPVGTEVKVRITISEPLKSFIDDNQLLFCYQMYQEGQKVQKYTKIGFLYLANSPPVVTSYTPNVMYYTEPTKIVLQGMALGAAQKIKLIDSRYECSGGSMNDRIRDEFGLAPGSLSSFLTTKENGNWYENDQESYTNQVFLMQVEGVINIKNDSQQERIFTLCLKYGDFSLSGGTPGYLTIGTITAKTLKIERLGSTHIYSGQHASFSFIGSGFLGQTDMACKLVHKYHTCSGVSPIDGIVAGGSDCSLLMYPNRSSTIMFADVAIPAGIETEANVCFRLGTASWQFVGVLAVKRPRVANAQLFHSSSNTTLQDLVKGEPFYARLILVSSLTSFDMLKVVPASVACSGTDNFADAVSGGAGTTINASGIASFDRGIDSEGQQVKICIWSYGSSGYVEDSSTRWSVNQPLVTRFFPQATSVEVTTQFQLTGRGLATSTQNTIVYASRGTQCATSGARFQLVSTDGMGGRKARMPAAFLIGGQYTVCFERGASLISIATVTVADLPTILALIPTVVYKTNSTAFLISSQGLTSTAQVKFVPPGDQCSGNTSLAGADWSTMAQISEDGASGTTVGFVFSDTGTGKMCFAADTHLTRIIDTGISIAIREWSPVILLSPQLKNKTDIQRVEANMTNVVPACAPNWKSKWMLRGPGNGIERDTPAIVDWMTEFKCYNRQEDIPQGVSSAYAPPGIDARLVSTVRGMPIEFVMAGGIGVGDKIFISQGKCGDNLTQPLLDPAANYVPGGQAVEVTESMLFDATGYLCRGVRKDYAVKFGFSPSVGTTMEVTGANLRKYGVKVSFTLLEISSVGQFHQLCVVPAGGATAISVEKIDLKVRPPMLLAMQPPSVFSGMRMPYMLSGVGLSEGDKIKIMDGETFAACERLDDESDLRGGRVATLDAETSSVASRIEFTFEIPSKHARVCYKYRGSNVWGEMTNALTLTTSGYIYGYDDALHFRFGEMAIQQSGDNMVMGRNQTILVQAPVAKFIIGDQFLARKAFSLIVEGDGLTEKSIYIIMPIRARCGGMPVGRKNLMKDKTVFSSVRLVTAIGGEPRPPAIYSNDPVDSFEKMSQCTGTNIANGCFAARATSRNSVDFPVGISINDLGRARVCYMHDFASEYQEVGQIQILPPYISSVYPRFATLNIPFSITVRGDSLRSTDRMKIVDGVTCNAPISSRPYTMPVSVADSPLMSTAVTHLTLTGKGTYTSGQRKICYSYDRGITYQDAGFTMMVKSPQVNRVFPTTLAVGGERRIWFFGEVISPGDRVKIIHSSRKCQGLDDWESIVYGGEGRALDLMTAEGQTLPSPIGESQWPKPWPNGSSIFKLLRTDEAVICYLHRESAGWEDVRGPDGKRIIITARVTSDLALGRTGPEWGNSAGRVYGGNGSWLCWSAVLAVLCFFI